MGFYQDTGNGCIRSRVSHTISLAVTGSTHCTRRVPEMQMSHLPLALVPGHPGDLKAKCPGLPGIAMWYKRDRKRTEKGWFLTNRSPFRWGLSGLYFEAPGLMGASCSLVFSQPQGW